LDIDKRRVLQRVHKEKSNTMNVTKQTSVYTRDVVKTSSGKTKTKSKTLALKTKTKTKMLALLVNIDCHHHYHQHHV